MSKSLRINRDGTIQVPTFDLPISAALSEEARRAQVGQLGKSVIELPDFAQLGSATEFAAYVDAYRKQLDETVAKPLSEAMAASFPVNVEAQEIRGVGVELFQLAEPDMPSQRMLLNLHGGAFISGSKYIARAEAIPIAHLSGIPVISIDYRMGYEHKFPDALDDVSSVYQQMLQQYSPSQIGIYGGSAGGRLTAQVVAHFIQEGIPVPGAIGVFGSGGGGPGGDSTYLSAIGMAKVPPRPGTDPIEEILFGRFGYMAGVPRGNPVAEPLAAGDELLSRYPPTLMVTATRAFDLSPATAFHRALVRAGVDASLHVFDGLGHCFYYNAWIPESRDAYQTMVEFFTRRLGVEI
jgi:monoterpene epsilon-lactone hydrolase